MKPCDPRVGAPREGPREGTRAFVSYWGYRYKRQGHSLDRYSLFLSSPYYPRVARSIDFAIDDSDRSERSLSRAWRIAYGASRIAHRTHRRTNTFPRVFHVFHVSLRVDKRLRCALITLVII